MEKFRTCIERVFERWARFIAGHPWKVIFCIVIINTMFGLQLLSLKLNNNILGLYVAERTDATKARDMLLRYFPDNSGHNFEPNSSLLLPLYAEVIVSEIHDGNVLSENMSAEVERLMQEVISINATSWYGDAVNFFSVCAKNNGTCVIEGASSLDHDFLGNVNFVNGSAINATYRKLRFHLRQESTNWQSESIRWLDKFIQRMKSYRSNSTKIVYSHSLSFYELLNSDTYIDIRYFGLAFTILITYCSFLIAGGDCLSKRTHLGRMGIIVTPLSVMGAWGFLSGCGMEFTNICGIMPFVALFVQINTMLLLLSRLSENFDDAYNNGGISGYKDRVSKSVQEASIPTLTLSLMLVVPFAFGIISKYRALEIFSLYTVTTLVFMFINHMTFFVACVAVHEKRIDNSRHCCTCTVITTPDDPHVQERSGCFRCCCTGRKPTSLEHTESCLERTPRLILTRFVLTTPVKVLICLALMGFIGCAIWQMIPVHIDFYHEEDVKVDTYFHDFNAINKAYFQSKPYVTFCPKEKEYDDDDHDDDDDDDDDDDRDELPYQDIRNINVYDTVIKTFGDKFIPNDDVWLKVYSDSNVYNDTSEAAFVEGLKLFLHDNSRFQRDVVFDRDNSHILMYKFQLQTVAEVSTDMFKDLRDDIDDDDDLDDMDIISYSPDFIFVDSLKPCLLEMIRFFGIQLAMLLMAIMFYPDRIRSSIGVTFWYILCIIGLLAFSSALGVFISSVAVVIYMICLSYFVTVILFSYYSFSMSEEETAPSRVHNVLNTTSSYLFSTSFASLCGLMIMFVEKSFVFITIFKILGTGVVIALVHACFFIPTVLSVTGSGKEADSSQKKNLAEINVQDIIGKANGIHTETGFTNYGYQSTSDEKF